MHSNKYIFIYSTVLVVLVAALLSATAMYLKPYQDKNVATEKMMSILSAAGISSTTENASQLYEQYIIKELVLDGQGNIVSQYDNGLFTLGNLRAFDLNATDDSSPKQIPLFVCVKESDTLYILPIRGKGLWGPIWGNIALKKDFSTIAGVTFDHKGETPGLGAEISTKEFQQQFIGKKIMDASIYVSVAAVKGGVINQTKIKPDNGVDAISGGTITSAGLTKMMYEGIKHYLPFFKNQGGTQKNTASIVSVVSDTLPINKKPSLLLDTLQKDTLLVDSLKTERKKKKKEVDAIDKEPKKSKKKKSKKVESDSTLTQQQEEAIPITEEIKKVEETIVPTMDEVKTVVEESIPTTKKKKRKVKESL